MTTMRIFQSKRSSGWTTNRPRDTSRRSLKGVAFAALIAGVTALPYTSFASAPGSTLDDPPVSSLTAVQPADSALPPEAMGDLHMARKRYQAAIGSYLQASPKSSSLWNKMGMANQQMFILPEAKKDYEAALKLDPKNPDVINNLGTVYYGMKLYATAEHYYRKALKYEPKSALIYKNLGTALMAEDKYKKGYACFQTAIAIDPKVFERVTQFRVGEPTPAQKRGAMNYFLAKSYAQAGMVDLAVGYLRMAIDEGFADRKKIMADTEFASLHKSTAFQELLSEQRAQ